jgi:hypothetical protein
MQKSTGKKYEQSVTALPLVAAMVLMSSIEIADVTRIVTMMVKQCTWSHCHFVYYTSHNLFAVISDGKSALHLAEDREHSAIINALWAAGAH